MAPETKHTKPFGWNNDGSINVAEANILLEIIFLHEECERSFLQIARQFNRFIGTYGHPRRPPGQNRKWTEHDVWFYYTAHREGLDTIKAKLVAAL